MRWPSAETASALHSGLSARELRGATKRQVSQASEALRPAKANVGHLGSHFGHAHAGRTPGAALTSSAQGMRHCFLAFTRFPKRGAPYHRRSHVPMLCSPVGLAGPWRDAGHPFQPLCRAVKLPSHSEFGSTAPIPEVVEEVQLRSGELRVMPNGKAQMVSDPRRPQGDTVWWSP